MVEEEKFIRRFAPSLILVGKINPPAQLFRIYPQIPSRGSFKFTHGKMRKEAFGLVNPSSALRQLPHDQIAFLGLADLLRF